MQQMNKNFYVNVRITEGKQPKISREKYDKHPTWYLFKLVQEENVAIDVM